MSYYRAPREESLFFRFPEELPIVVRGATTTGTRARRRSAAGSTSRSGARLNFNYPTKAGYAKFNWIIVVPEYYNMKYIAHCEEMYDVNFAFNALSGDV